MFFKVIALDLDGTIAMQDKIEDETWRILREIKELGRCIIVVTGRRLEVIEELGPLEELCDAIVSEDGAAIYYPRNQMVMLPFGHVPVELYDQLIAAGVRAERGLALVATTETYQEAVLRTVGKLGMALAIEYNKGAVMVLPPGATKGTGVVVALRELGYSVHNVMAFGDAENDRSLFEQVELSIAVKNADPGIRELADIQLQEENGTGVRNFLQKMLKGSWIPMVKSNRKRQLSLGNLKNGNPLFLDALTLLKGNMGIFGSSGSGKSWMAGLIAEKLLQLEYQICIIDPEGDYRSMKAFPNTLLLGGVDGPPPGGAEVSTLLEYSNISLVLDLSQYSFEDRDIYVFNLMQTLLNLRERRGKPHWFLIDEIHYFCRDQNQPLTQLIEDRLEEGGFALVSFRPSEIAPSLISQINHVVVTHLDQEEIEKVEDWSIQKGFQKVDLYSLSCLSQKEVYLFADGTWSESGLVQGIVEIEKTHRQVPHIRHLHKYLRAPLPRDKRFYFDPQHLHNFVPPAGSLYDFLRILDQIPAKALSYHLYRGDFESWIKDTLHDEVLAKRFRKMANRRLSTEELPRLIKEAVRSRYEDLERLI